MRLSHLRLVFCAHLWAFLGLGALVTSPVTAIELESRQSDSINIVYAGPLFAYLIPHIAACSENALAFHRELYGYTPSEDVTIFLEDFSDFGNGGADTVPTNRVKLHVAPFNYIYDTIPAIDRMFWMANHELAHVATMDQGAGRDLAWRRFFQGKVLPTADNPLSIGYNYLTNPRWSSPRWYREGIAVNLETWMSGGVGRVMGAYDEMVFRSKVQGDGHFYDLVGLESEGAAIDFQVGVNAYLYGARFMAYLSYQYGPEKLIEWTRRGPDTRAHFLTQFRHVYGAELADEWRRWIEFEKAWQTGNLERIAQHPTTSFVALSDVPLGSVSKAFLDADSGKILVAVRYPGQFAHIAALDPETGELKKLANVRGPALFYVTSMAFDPGGRTVFFTTDNNGWRDLNALDVATGKTRRLMKDARVGDLAFNRQDRSLWGVRHMNGISTVVRMPAPYAEWEQVHSWPYGSDIYEIDISPDGKLLAGSIAEADGTQRLVAFEVATMLEAEIEETTLFDFETASPANFTFSPDGRYLYGTSYYSGVSNVYRYDLVEDDMSALSNAETGFFRPVPLNDQELLVFNYSGDGLSPGTIPNRVVDRVSAIRFLGQGIVEKHPIVREWKAASPSSLNIAEMTTEGSYRAGASLRLRSVYPIVEGYKDSAAYGLRMSFSDALNLTGIDLTTSFTPDDEELSSSEQIHAVLEFHHWNWDVTAKWNGGDFYDLFGPTKRSREGYSLGIGYTKTLANDEAWAWRIRPEVAYYGDLEVLPDYQNVGATSDELINASVELDYEYLRKSLGSVEHEAGTRWRIIADGNYADSNLEPLLLTSFDKGWLTALDHSSLWLRASAGQSFGDETSPFGQFFLGGFGNNYVDHRSEQRYREWFAFPGVELNEIGGKNYLKAMLEWNLPPIRFRNVGVPSLYLNWVRLSLFGGAVRTNFDDSVLRRDWTNLGAQLDLRVVLFSDLTSTLSIGYASAEERDGGSSDEFMISLKIL